MRRRVDRRLNVNGALAGVTLGYNYQTGTLGLGPGSRWRLQLDQGHHDHRLRRHLRNKKHLACHGARPHRLCRLEPLAALYHRRRRLRRRQDQRRVLAADPRPSSAGPPAPASNTRSGATGRPRSNISMPISATATCTAPSCGVADVDGKFNAHHRAPRLELPLLTAPAARLTTKPRAWRPGFFLLARARAGRRDPS